jgi:hypothetical protein
MPLSAAAPRTHVPVLTEDLPKADGTAIDGAGQADRQLNFVRMAA